MSARVRHARRPGQPRSVWPAASEPVEGTTLPDPVPSPLSDAGTLALRDQLARAQWDAIRDEFGVIAAYEATTPRYWRRAFRRMLRQFRNAYLALLTVAYLGGAVVGPVAHGMRWW